jgi:death-on-curing protein
MQCPSKAQVLRLHEDIVAVSGGSAGLRDEGALDSALAQPFASFGGQDLYPTLIDKAAALGFSLINNHPFIDGNKRIGHAVMVIFLRLNGLDMEAPMDEQERLILSVAAGETDRDGFNAWLREHVVSLSE